MLSRFGTFSILKSTTNWQTLLESFATYKMPKKKGHVGKVTAATTDIATNSKAVGNPISIGKDGDISIAIQVKPGAKTDAITDVSDTSVGVQISAPPVDGEANAAIVKYFAALLKVKKTDVSIKGGKSRQKTIFISASAGLSPTDITTILKAEQEH